MPADAEIKAEHRATQMFDSTVANLVMTLGVSELEACVFLIQCAASRIGNNTIKTAPRIAAFIG